IGKASMLTRLLLGNLYKVAFWDRNRRTRLSCACVALAAEEYQLDQQRWPESAEELVKTKLLQDIPIDLVDGKPLRWRRTDDGLVIHSLAPSGKYEGDALDEDRPPGTAQRCEFRLWNVDRRGRPAPAEGAS